jgi:hypothetical protein
VLVNTSVLHTLHTPVRTPVQKQQPAPKRVLARTPRFLRGVQQCRLDLGPLFEGGVQGVHP